ncbi:MAG TPA: hypothetical protein DCO78_02170, partial [Chitinophagaceae bacterium]|nr:hypothetical protein [Chitinophagaceae bacterium]
MTYNEIIELRNKLLGGEIEIEFAQKQYWMDFEVGKKSWHTKDWKERRDKVIKDNCQICGSKESLTLQHLSHPRKYAEYITEIRRSYANNYINSNPEIDKSTFSNYVLKEYDFEPTPLCPNCKNTNPSRRIRKVPQYRCSGCKQEFNEPVYKSVDELITIFFEDEDAIEIRDKCFVSKKWNTKYNLSSIKYWFQREHAENNS